MMKREKQYKLKLNIPYEAIMILLAFVFTIVVCIWQYSIKSEIEYLVMIFGVLIAISFFSWLFNNIYKNLNIRGEEITVRYWFGLNSTTLKKQDIKGYKIKETYTRHGLDYHIQIVPFKGNKIEFIKDAYANYERLEFYLKSFGVPYVGMENINSPFKKISARIIVLSTAIIPMLYLLLQLLKLAK